MFSLAVLEKLFLVKVSSCTRSALWVSSASVSCELWSAVKFSLAGEEAEIGLAEMAVVELVLSSDVSGQLRECLQCCPSLTDRALVGQKTSILSLNFFRFKTNLIFSVHLVNIVLQLREH